MLKEKTLINFIRESNHIERLDNVDPYSQLQTYKDFLALEDLTVGNVTMFVGAIQPGAVLRDRLGLNVRVGNFVPPHGGPQIRSDLEVLIADINDGIPSLEGHVRYERLHPYTDGNGRSGRAIWLWTFGDVTESIEELGGSFLHWWYYESLEAFRRKKHYED